MIVHIFLGPSLPWKEAQEILPDAIVLPPAQAGDIYKSVQQGAQVIAIVDGFFEQVPSVWHKEILYALSKGVHVFGASSMGALRAAETHAFGMVGVGQIFKRYCEGSFEDDDEVTVVHASKEEDFKPLSEAMVNIRYGLSIALERNLIRQVTHDTLLRQIKGRYYGERTWALLPEIGRKEGLDPLEVEALISFVRREKPNLKRQDTLELLTTLRSMHQELRSPFEASFYFEATVYWEQLAASVRSAPSGQHENITADSIRAHLAVVEPDAESMFHGALLLYLAAKEAKRAGIHPEPEQVQRVAERFRRSHGLTSAAATHRWLKQNQLGHAEFSALMELIALRDAVLEFHASGVDVFLPAELKRRGCFAAVAQVVPEKHHIVSSFGLTFPSPEDLGITHKSLLVWYQTRFRPIEESLEEHHKMRGVSSQGRFLRELLVEYLYERNQASPPLRAMGGADV